MERYVHRDHRQMQSSVPSCGFLHLSEETHPEVGFSPMPGCKGLVSANYLRGGLINMCRHVPSHKINTYLFVALGRQKARQYCL